MKRALSKRFRGTIEADIAVSPLAMLAMVVVTAAFLMVLYYGVCSLFFNQVLIQGARDASTNSNVSTVRSLIYNTTIKVLPESKAGITLFSINDIDINASDGDHVTTKATYHVMLPGLSLYEKFGGKASDWIVPVQAKFSFFREY